MDYVTDEHGVPASRWDGHTTKPHPVTGEQVPNETARVPLERYANPRPAEWPAADYVVGNPPFIGTKRMRDALGDGYTEALRQSWPEVPESADFVMYWWHKAALQIRAGALKRFGFITTNSLTQTFNRRVLEQHLHELHLAYAVPDHPWVDSADGAAVRIAMTVAAPGSGTGLLQTVIDESGIDGDAVHVDLADKTGNIHADLSLGANVSGAQPLQANDGLCGMGVALHGSGFILAPEIADTMSAHGTTVIKPYLGGKDLLQSRRERYLIDFSGLEQEAARQANPAAFQHVIDYVKPERDHNSRTSIRELWWRFGWERPQLRKALAGLPRYIGTTETAKHRVFQFIDGSVLADHMVVCIALADAWQLGVLSSRVHVTWALAAGGTLEDRPRYNKTRCFDPFPFPAATPEQQARIRALAEELDAHRKRQQAAHPELTLTGMYNVLEKLRTGEPLTAKDKTIHEQGLVSVLKQLHDELDAAVLDAYGWSDLRPSPASGGGAGGEGLNTDALLERLVALNAERRREEAAGRVRWLRPEFQNPEARPDTAETASPDEATIPAAKPVAMVKQPWPATLPEQVAAVARVLTEAAAPLSEADLAARFTGKGPWKKRLPQLLDTLVALGRARKAAEGWLS
jgi:hypothetical protein